MPRCTRPVVVGAFIAGTISLLISMTIGEASTLLLAVLLLLLLSTDPFDDG